jgi:hypothetical protein
MVLLLFQARDFFYIVGLTVLLCLGFVFFVKFLLSREKRKGNPKLRDVYGINRSQRRKERAASRRKRT